MSDDQTPKERYLAGFAELVRLTVGDLAVPDSLWDELHAAWRDMSPSERSEVEAMERARGRRPQ